jgi:hypothetical protein
VDCKHLGKDFFEIIFSTSCIEYLVIEMPSPFHQFPARPHHDSVVEEPEEARKAPCGKLKAA